MPKGDRFNLKADPDDGTTPVANLLLEAVAIAKLSGKEKGAILFLWRHTYGWLNQGIRPKELEIGLDRWAKVLQTDRTSASKILGSLSQKSIFHRRFLGPGKGYIYSMNTRISTWNSDCIDLPLLKEIARLDNDNNSGEKSPPLQDSTTPPLSKITTPLATNSASLKKHIKKHISWSSTTGTPLASLHIRN